MPHLFNSAKNEKVTTTYSEVPIHLTTVKEGIDDNGNRICISEKLPFDYTPEAVQYDDFSIENLSKAGVNLKEVTNFDTSSRFSGESDFITNLSTLENVEINPINNE